MPHIHTEPGQHDHTVSAFIVRTDTPEPVALLHMHRKFGRLLQIGGHVEPNETPWQAIAHEIREETGYSMDQLSILQPQDRVQQLTRGVLHPQYVAVNTHPIGTDHLHTDGAYAFVARSSPQNPVGEGESTDLRWVNLTELEALDESLMYPDIKVLYRHVLTVCLERWEAVDTASFA